jgi:hypothetical protein
MDVMNAVAASLVAARSHPVTQRWGRPVAAGLAIAVALGGAAVFLVALASGGWPDFWFGDLAVLTNATQRLIDGESWYLERQLHGPYERAFGEILYPPVVAWFIVPWLVLPSWTFIAIPAAIVAWHVVSVRPAPWTWPLIAFGLTFPITLVHAAYANPTTWMVALVALGLRFGWPSALVLLKPSLLPFALVGIRSRGWWLCATVLAFASLPFLGETLDYPRILLDWRGGDLLYSLQSLPVMLVPVVAWLGRSR